MKHLQRFNEYEVNEGLKGLALAGFLSLASLTPAESKEIKKEVKTEVVKSDDNIAEAKGSKIKKDLKKWSENLSGKSARGTTPVETHFIDEKMYCYVLVVANSEKEALDKGLDVFKDKEIVNLFLVMVDDNTFIVYGNKLS